MQYEDKENIVYMKTTTKTNKASAIQLRWVNMLEPFQENGPLLLPCQRLCAHQDCCQI